MTIATPIATGRTRTSTFGGQNFTQPRNERICRVQSGGPSPVAPASAIPTIQAPVYLASSVNSHRKRPSIEPAPNEICRHHTYYRTSAHGNIPQVAEAVFGRHRAESRSMSGIYGIRRQHTFYHSPIAPQTPYH